jgi:hypothetical protein
MSGESNGKAKIYRVAYSGSVAKTIQEHRYQAFLLGRRAEFDAALAAVIRRLRDDPSNFGELVQTLHHLKLAVHVAPCFPSLSALQSTKRNRSFSLRRFF